MGDFCPLTIQRQQPGSPHGHALVALTGGLVKVDKVLAVQ
jgi:hypothetical protein